jgi:hypothetical protein
MPGVFETPVDLRRSLSVRRPVARMRYELEEVTPGGLQAAVANV